MRENVTKNSGNYIRTALILFLLATEWTQSLQEIIAKDILHSTESTQYNHNIIQTLHNMIQSLLHKLKVYILCCFGLAIDIHSSGKWPSYALSNFYPHEFEFEGIKCGSMEGFLQAIKTQDTNRQEMVCSLSRKDAKLRSTDTWKKEQNIYWKCKTYNRHGYRFQFLLRRAYREMIKQCPKFREALIATGTKRLYHTIGKTDAHNTILTEREFCTILTELRSEIFKVHK